jgi:tetratricopeptide (TPR) repeat protein
MRCRLLACAVIALSLVSPASAQLENVGQLSFPTSGSADAQRHFLRGVAILHSFGWKQAIAEFQLAQKAQPDFAMAYWGESLCYNHPLNSQMDYKDPRAVLARLGPDRAARLAKAPTPREKGFITAVEELWGEGDSRQRRVNYMNAMERLYKQFPGDDEVKTFYALSILSASTAVDDRTSRMNVKAGALAMDVFKRNPNHPGATHYIIHAFDDPVHAPLALEAAQVYAKIVPAVSHAVHMPTHIFIQHGMWNEVANQNIRAFNVAKDLWQPGDVPGDMSHSGDWGQYGFLQLGDYAGARERIQAFEWMADTTKNQRAIGALSLVRARYIIETEEWKVQPVGDSASNDTILANGFSAVKTGDMATAAKMETMLAAKAGAAPSGAASANPHADHGGAPAPAAPAGGSDAGKNVRVMHKELSALIAQAKGQTDQAIALLKEAVTIEESMRPPNGAADPIKPSHELLGEVLLQAGKPKEAADAFDVSLLRMPNRARSLMGAIKAHAAAGNKDKAAERLATLNSFWKGKPFTNPGTDAR